MCVCVNCGKYIIVICDCVVKCNCVNKVNVCDCQELGGGWDIGRDGL